MAITISKFNQRLSAGDTRAWRQALGLAIAVMGFVLITGHALQTLVQWVSSNPSVKMAFAATMITGIATGVGALPVLFFKKISSRINDSLMGFGAGVMMAASVFSLLLPAMAGATEIYASKMQASMMIAVAVAMGAALLLAMDKLMPHQHFVTGAKGMPMSADWSKRASGLWLFVLAIALHNLPEGLAVGVAVTGDTSAWSLAVGMAIQNMPEGLVVALAMQSLGWKAGPAVLVALATGLLEPIGGLMGAALVQTAQMVLPIALAFSAGAMLFVVSHEIIPESHRNGHETNATIGLMLGFMVMMVLDTALA